MVVLEKLAPFDEGMKAYLSKAKVSENPYTQAVDEHRITQYDMDVYMSLVSKAYSWFKGYAEAEKIYG